MTTQTPYMDLVCYVKGRLDLSPYDSPGVYLNETIAYNRQPTLAPYIQPIDAVPSRLKMERDFHAMLVDHNLTPWAIAKAVRGLVRHPESPQKPLKLNEHRFYPEIDKDSLEATCVLKGVHLTKEVPFLINNLSLLQTLLGQHAGLSPRKITFELENCFYPKKDLPLINDLVFNHQQTDELLEVSISSEVQCYPSQVIIEVYPHE